MAGKKPQDFTPHQLFRRIDAQAMSRDYRHKQAIFAQGDKADAMFYVQNGNVKLTVASKGGKKAVIAILRQGSTCFFGEGCLVRQSMRVSRCNGDSALNDRAEVQKGLHRSIDS